MRPGLSEEGKTGATKSYHSETQGTRKEPEPTKVYARCADNRSDLPLCGYMSGSWERFLDFFGALAGGSAGVTAAGSIF
jgi:hypothetical protein